MKFMQLVSEFMKLVERVQKLESLSSVQLENVAPINVPVQKVVETKEVSEVKETKLAGELSEYPVPQEYREVVDVILNKNFKIFVDYKDGNLDFNLSVPDKYSNLTPEARKISGGMDRRRRIIPPYEGVNGVKEYLGLVWKSFSPTIQSMIVADRS